MRWIHAGRALRASLAVLALTAGCGGGEDPLAVDTDGEASGTPSENTPTDTAPPAPEPLVMADLEGTWHGRIGEGYRGGCLCLTLEADGTVGEPSGITMGFDVSGGSTVIVDADAREVDIVTMVVGSPFHIREAIVDPEGDLIEGRWEGESPSPFDDDIVVDREPETCQERTGLNGAPC